MHSYIYEHKNGISLRKVEQEDLPLLKELKDESWFGTHHVAIVNMFNQQKWFEKISGDNSCYFLIAHDTKKNTDVGLYKIANIDNTNRCYDSAHDVFKHQRGKSFSKPVLEAGVDFGFEILNMHRINTEVLENNEASYKTAKYVGFSDEGVKRKSVWKVNQYLDSRMLGIIREEWVSLERVMAYGGCCNKSYEPKNTKNTKK